MSSPVMKISGSACLGEEPSTTAENVQSEIIVLAVPYGSHF